MLAGARGCQSAVQEFVFLLGGYGRLRLRGTTHGHGGVCVKQMLEQLRMFIWLHAAFDDNRFAQRDCTCTIAHAHDTGRPKKRTLVYCMRYTRHTRVWAAGNL